VSLHVLKTSRWLRGSMNWPWLLGDVEGDEEEDWVEEETVEEELDVVRDLLSTNSA